MYCTSLLSHITSRTCITERSKTLTDHIFINAYDSTFKSENLLFSLSDHNAQFLFLENQVKTNKSTERQYYRYLTAMKKQKTEINEQLQKINWAVELRLDKNNVNLSTDLLIKKTKTLIDFWAPLQLTSKSKRKSCNKPWIWITKDLLTSIIVKNKLYKK